MNQTFMLHPHKSKVSANVDDGNCLTIVVDGERISDCTTIHLWIDSLDEIEAIGQQILAEVARLKAGESEEACSGVSKAKVLEITEYAEPCYLNDN